VHIYMLRLQKFCIVSQKLLVEKYKEIVSSHKIKSTLKSDAVTKLQVQSIEESTARLNAKIEESTKQYNAMFSASELISSVCTDASHRGVSREEDSSSQMIDCNADRDVVGCCEQDGNDRVDDHEDEGDVARELLALTADGHGLAAALQTRDQDYLLSTSHLLREADELVCSLSHTVGKVQGFSASHSMDEELNLDNLSSS
jgi:hypothetical protein